MAKNKVYAVKQGYRTGKFYDWDVVKGLVAGYKGAEYKSFSGVNAEKEADLYLGLSSDASSTLVLERVENNSSDYVPFEAYDNPYQCDDTSCIAFVDGSYDKHKKLYSYGAVVFTKEKKYCMCGCDDADYLVGMHQISGELLGAMMAILKAESLGMKKIMIVHDLEGTAEWVATDKKPWNANKRGTFEYQRFVANHRQKIDITYKWVKGHAGITHNEEADKLAERARVNDIRCDSASVFANLVSL